MGVVRYGVMEAWVGDIIWLIDSVLVLGLDV